MDSSSKKRKRSGSKSRSRSKSRSKNRSKSRSSSSKKSHKVMRETVHSLPLEMKMTMIPFLDDQALLALRGTNKQWKGFVDNECRHLLQQMGISLNPGQNACREYTKERCKKQLKDAGYPVQGYHSGYRTENPCNRWRRIQEGHHSLFRALTPQQRRLARNEEVPLLAELSTRVLGVQEGIKTRPDLFSERDLRVEKNALNEMFLNIFEDEDPKLRDFYLRSIYHEPKWSKQLLEVIETLPDKDYILWKNREFLPQRPHPFLESPPSSASSGSRRSSRASSRSSRRSSRSGGSRRSSSGGSGGH